MSYSRLDQGTATVVRLRGQLDTLVLADLTPLLNELAIGRQQVIVVDLSSLRLIDSAGIRCLLSFCNRVRARSAQVRVIGMLGQPRALFELMGFEPDMGIKTNCAPSSAAAH